MFCSPISLTDAKLDAKVKEVKKAILDSESSLVRASPTLCYSQIAERVGDLNRMRNFLRALKFEFEVRGFREQKDGSWLKKSG